MTTSMVGAEGRPLKALITGATDGIGRATAAALARQGWEVIAVGRSAERLAATVEELRALNPSASGLRADLSRMSEVAALARGYREAHPTLDLLLLNANHITPEHQLTADGLEQNLAIGFYGRALLAWSLEEVLRRTPGAAVLGVVGLNLERVDLDAAVDPVSSMRALGRWQWAHQMFTRAWTARVPVPTNTYMPGLVRTKILASEPQPMRLLVQIAQRLVGVPVERGGAELAQVVGELRGDPAQDVYYSRTKRRGQRALGEQPGDADRVWAHAERVLAPWRDQRRG